MGYHLRAQPAARPRETGCATPHVCAARTGVGSGYRYYSPALGRWVNRDPIGERGGWHLYAFVGNRPFLFVDLLGMQIWIERSIARSIMQDLQEVIGDAARLVIAEEARRPHAGFPQRQVRMVRLHFENENPESVCYPCWENLKAAIERDEVISVHYQRDVSFNPRGTRNVFIDPKRTVTLYGFRDRSRVDTVAPPFQGDDAIRFQQPRAIMTWHEVIAHAHKNLEDSVHPITAENWTRWRSATVAEEHRAVDCINRHRRQQGRTDMLMYRHPFYYRTSDRVLHPDREPAPLIESLP